MISLSASENMFYRVVSNCVLCRLKIYNNNMNWSDIMFEYEKLANTEMQTLNLN